MTSNASRSLLLRAAALAAGAAALLGGTALAQSQTQAPRDGGTLTAIVQPEPVTLTSAINTAAPTGFISGNVFDGLVDYDLDLNPRPALAERWEVAPDGLSITFFLRKGVTWHDGHPFTSADVKWTLENVWKTIHPRNQATFGRVTRVETPDDLTVILRLSEPSLAILSSVNSNGAQVLPKHLYEGTDVLNNPHNLKPVGTGAFVFKEWSKGNHLILERNPNYWDKGKPHLDRVVFKVIPDAAARAAALEKGDVQYAVFSPVPLKDAERLGKLPGLKIETRGYEWISPWLFFDLNVDNQYLKDVRVRRAIAHAIDRKAISNIVWYGFAKPAISPVPSTLPAFHDASVPQYEFDVRKAEALLDEAGYKRGADGVRFALTHDFIPYGDDYKRTGEYLKQALKRVGIEVTIRSQDTAAFTKRVYGDRDFDISSAWFAAFSDPQVGVTRAYWSGWVGKNTPWTNGSGYRNPEVDALIAQAQGQARQEDRIATFKRIQQIVQTDLPSIPLAELKFFSVHAANLKDVVTHGDQIYGSLKDAWFDKAASN
ncbi:peptide/nickel transport system substrate-binding protein [Azospirillum agricola]|uniref:ABC transporter substrate-binding protein n=1 Tax=Azospirillum agricola TaxID=1720247 RepID=UPI001AE92FF1|nr:ABC transporter substrate-binding protein [Azospirillum agricola]MBP2229191.1 peptide/nickel transport system substrate-binding protein [Azospirillum agricola]